jgi:hypothetical protein
MRFSNTIPISIASSRYECLMGLDVPVVTTKMAPQKQANAKKHPISSAAITLWPN